MNEEDQERMAVLFTGPMLLLGLLGGTGGWIALKGQEATSWLIDHGILVPRGEAMIPILDAGLDTARVVLAAAVVFLLIWGSVATARKTRRA